jgi:predicted phage terminase large subunit-like protein
MIMQRLHDDDPTGFVLNGGTGEEWEHLKVPVIRPNGEPLWPFRHKMADLLSIQLADKFVWNGQYMQEPIPDEGDFFLAEKARWYTTPPKHLNYYGASDYAASDASGADFTEHGVFGVCPDGNIYLTDWWSGQEKTDVWIEEQLDLALKYKTEIWAGETGPIKAAVEPWLTKRMRERKVYPVLKWVSHSTTNYKVANARSFQGLWEAGRVYLPEGKEWAQDVLRQLTRFPRGTLDDKVDVCSIFARMIAKVWEPSEPKPPPPEIKLDRVEIRMSDFEPKVKEW